MPDDVEERITALHRGPLEDFVATRDALAKELRAEDRERSAAVKRLRKPTVAAWALNRVAGDEPDAVEELRAAGAAVERAQQAALAGDRSELRSATERRRSVLAHLTDAAAAHAGDGHRDEIQATLEAASVDPDLHAELAAGRLATTAEARSGFGDLAGLLAASTDAAPADDDADRRRAAAEQLRARLGDAEHEVDRFDAEVGRAEAALARAQEALDAARQRLDAATAERDRLAADLDEADADA